MPIDPIAKAEKKRFEAIIKNLRRVWKDCKPGFEKVGHRFALDAVGNVKKNYLTGPRPEKLGVVTGRLRSSILYSLQVSRDDISIRFGTSVDYAQKHEEGDGVKKRPFLHPGVKEKIGKWREKARKIFIDVTKDALKRGK